MIKREDGQSLVEFALVIPLLLMLVIGVFDFGRVLYTHLNLELTAQEAVRLGGLGQEETAIRSYASSQFNGVFVDVDWAIISQEGTLEKVDRPEGHGKSGDYVTVTLTYPEEFLDVLGNASIPYTVETSSTIRVE